ncbi:histone deacetylase 1/2 [Cryptococcus wingfieldii CBS 7118]|uniref:Histone deacetylase 1/2 n=1 Tax=Cryptococcus wingfieldii CBS 7118 TaxID=1295528 RepID=A0A1E3K227_9TREE|nr:histone deacetylase 1/2 [Cryptococcus wingfieldii CBS 7118]ODO07224.1 histone deacetylase 1/2 [Cryptococcus wingfieldii CBS 7118]
MSSKKQTSFEPLDPTPLRPDGRRVAYFYDHDVGNYHFTLGHPMKPHRIRMAHNLVVNYGLADSDDEMEGLEEEGSRQLNGELGMVGEEGKWNTAGLRGARGRGVQILRPQRATKMDMTKFHTDEYIQLLKDVMPENADALTGNGTRCLVGSDCPAVEGIFEFASISAGGSIAAAERLNSGAADIAINWPGGLHHAKKSEASGFCFVNDIVLGILELLRFNSRVLYIDIDVHHGDGVEEAFYTTDRVMTCSFHLYGNFFPGTGQVKDVGLNKGKNYAVNVPLREGITDEGFQSIFKPVIGRIMEHYRPGAVVLQGGADSLSGDKLGKLNLTLAGHSECARFLKTFGVPLMMLGGGGYTTKNVARAWAKETAVALGKELAEDLPNNQYMEYYGPRYKMEVLASNADNYNTPEYLDEIKQQIFQHLKDLPFAPSAQMKCTPSIPVARAIGLRKEWDVEEPEDQLDQRLKKLLAQRNLDGLYSRDSGDESDDLIPRTSRSKRQGVSRPSRSSTTVNGRRKRYYEDAAFEDVTEDPCGVSSRKANGSQDRRALAGRDVEWPTPPGTASNSRDGRKGNLAGTRLASQRPTPESDDENDNEDHERGTPPKKERVGKRSFFAAARFGAGASTRPSVSSVVSEWR